MNELKVLIKQYWLAAILCVIFMIVFDYFFDTVCYTELLIGIPCPFAGITRATKLMLTGHFLASYKMHPLLIFVIFGFVSYILLKSKSIKYRNIMVFYGIMVLIAFIVFYIYRMMVYYPNIEPMVYKEENLLSWIIKIIN